MDFTKIKVTEPVNERSIFKSYSESKLSGKKKNKSYLQKKLGFHVESTVPLIAVVNSFLSERGKEVLFEVLSGILDLNSQIAVFGFSDKELQYMKVFERRNNFRIYTGDIEELYQLIASSDMVLIPEDDTSRHLSQKLALNFGAIPIIVEHDDMDGQIVDYNQNYERGEAFVSKMLEPFSVFASTVRALENFKFSYDWSNIQKSAMILGERIMEL